MIINRAALDGIFTSFRADYQAGTLAAKPLKDRFAMTSQSSTREETYGWLGAYNSLREWIGDRQLNGLVAHGFTIKNRTFENTVSVSREDIEDDMIGVYSGAFQLMGADAAMHPDKLIFELLRAGTTSTCYDGQNFFDTDHPINPDSATAGTVSNCDMVNPSDAPEWVLMDTSKVIKPFIFQRRKDYTFVAKDQDSDENAFMRNEYVYGVEARVNAGYGLWQLAYGSNKDLSYANYATARAAMMKLKAPNGNPLGIVPDVLLVSPDYEAKARDLILTPKYNDGAMNGTAEIIVCPWLGA
jgi:phage major head subunit gpT-like protein